MAYADRRAPTSDADFTAATNRSLLSRLYTGTGAFEIVGREMPLTDENSSMFLILWSSIPALSRRASECGGACPRSCIVFRMARKGQGQQAAT